MTKLRFILNNNASDKLKAVKQHLIGTDQKYLHLDYDKNHKQNLNRTVIDIKSNGEIVTSMVNFPIAVDRVLGKEILIIKKKRRKRMRKTIGFRPHFTKISLTNSKEA